ncbi:MAG: glycosyltransferase 87 family protein [Solirubrobacterales bacterium]
MSRRNRLLALALVAVIHLAAFAPTIGSYSSILDRGFWPQAERVLDGDLPYREVNFEYPPLALPPVVAPAALSDGVEGYRHAFELELLFFDLAIVAVLALCAPGPERRVWQALGVYSVCVIATSGVVLWDSTIEAAPLVLARFDLIPALLILAALLARRARRSAAWAGMLGAAVAIKAFPALLVPSMARGEHRGRRAAIALGLPILAVAAVVVISGDEFASAIDYHRDRDLQIETVAATPLMLAHQLGGTGARVVVGGGSFNLAAPGAGLAKAASIALLLGSVALILYMAHRRRLDPFVEATALLAAVVAFAPVLSPQFLLWVLPVSAVAYGLGRENVVLIGCFVLTQDVLHNYIGVEALEGPFVWSLAARNALLLVYLALVLLPVFRPGARPVPFEAVIQHPPRERRNPVSTRSRTGAQGEGRGGAA